MRKIIQLLLIASLIHSTAISQTNKPLEENHNGMFSLGLRSTLSTFGDDGTGLGAGGQFRIQLSDKVNTEWFADYISINQENKVRSVYYHIGWSVMFYPFEHGWIHIHTKNLNFTYTGHHYNLFQPYIVAGHCFDYNKMTEIGNTSNNKHRWGSAVQAGIGTHINLSQNLDVSLSSQYMMHLTTDLHAETTSGPVVIETEKENALQGHLLTTLSVNYKLARLWKASTANKKESKELIHKGLLSAQATIAPSYMFADKTGYFYLNGGMEWYMNKKISFAGELYYFLGAQGQRNSFDYNHNVFFGASRHFVKKNNDFFLGLQPGVAFLKIKASTFNLAETKTGIDPLVSVIGGYNYFVNNVFHFFVQSRFIAGGHNADVNMGLTELRFSGGLGFNL
jgi:hypothetical protein